VSTLNPAQVEAFMEDYDFSDGSGSDTDDEKPAHSDGGGGYVYPWDAPPAPAMPAPLMTRLPDGARGTPLEHLGEQFAQQGPGGSHLEKREQKALAAALAASLDTQPDFSQIKSDDRRERLQRRYDEALDRVSDRTTGREVELDGYDSFEVRPSCRRGASLRGGTDAHLKGMALRGII
jgi:hypothetical protein